jgi:hypothetical protein
VAEVPDFSKLAAEYAASRPAYPAELFEWLAGVAPARNTRLGRGDGERAGGRRSRDALRAA